MHTPPVLWATCLLLLLFFASCSRPAATTTRYEPPGTPGGRLCLNQCREARDYCRKDCELDQRRCTLGMQARAIKDYEAYAHEQLTTHAPLDLQPRDFERPDSCRPVACDENCARDYQSCYEACGGKVIISSSCRFFCS